MNQFKYGKESIMSTLLNNNTFIKSNRFNRHKEER